MLDIQLVKQEKVKLKSMHSCENRDMVVIMHKEKFDDQFESQLFITMSMHTKLVISGL